jgi:hypothetical protein
MKVSKVVLVSVAGLMLASAANAHTARTVDARSFKAMGSWNVHSKFGDSGNGRVVWRNKRVGGPFSVSPESPASPAPEPGTWAMMIVGVGLVAFQLRRKQQKLGTQAV